jgi:cysteinyl-tRNA synthetase, unknown class
MVNITSKFRKLVLVVAVLLPLVLGPSLAEERQAKAQEAATPPDWSLVNDFTYQLQNINLAALGNTNFDLVIMDYSPDGSDRHRFTAQEVANLKNSPGGPKLVLSYMSIGEAEDYRWYWREGWDKNGDGVPDAGAPVWLGAANPDWPGNYKVRYWNPAWQRIVYRYVDRVLAAGYDGVYLDIVDAYEYWGPGGESGLDRASAEREMVNFVKGIARYARVQKGRPDFGVFVQNAEGLSVHPDYLQAVTGIGKEDLFYNDNQPQRPAETRYSIRQLDRFKAAGKPVLVTDYVTKPLLINAFYSKAKAKGYTPYATRRDLNVLTINPGHEPD